MTRCGMMGWLAGALLAATGIAAADTAPYLFNDINKTQVITASSCPYYFVPLGDYVYFVADDGVTGSRVWRTDGTEGGTIPWSPEGLLVSDLDNFRSPLLGILPFFAYVEDEIEMWITDGTPGGTKRVGGMEEVLDSEATPYSRGYCISLGDRLYAVIGAELWKLSPDFQSAERIVDSQGSYYRSYLATTDRIYYFYSDDEHGVELWSTDGTVEGDALVKDIVPGPGSSGAVTYGFVVPMGSVGLFHVMDGSLWRTDGTEEGTFKLLEKVQQGGEFQGWLGWNSERAYFAADRTVWTTDGTVDGTKLVKTFGEDFGFVESNSSGEFTNGIFLFRISQFHVGSTLVRTDGTEEGTYLLNNTTSGILSHLGPEMNGLRYFACPDQNSQFLGYTDGTQEGTVRFMEIPGDLYSTPCNAFQVWPRGELPGGRFVYSPRASEGVEVWVSDGTAEGTEFVKNIAADTTTSKPTVAGAGPSNLFIQSKPEYNLSLLRSDGIPEGTLTPLESGLSSLQTVMLKNVMVYSDYDQQNPHRSDGTPEGTAPLSGSWWDMDIPDAWRGFREFMGTSEGQAYYGVDLRVGYDRIGNELWKTDGTESGTLMLRRFLFSEGEGLSDRWWYPRPKVTRFGGAFYFSAKSSDSVVPRLWRSDGTVEGTVMVPSEWIVDPGNFSPFGNRFFFVAEIPLERLVEGLWISDGTDSNSVFLNRVNPTTPIVELAGQGYFKGVDAEAKAEQLWRSNGAPEGTLPIKTFTPGPGGVAPLSNDADPIVVAGRLAFFAANDGVVGRELWVLDTRAGEEIRLVADIRSGALGANIHNMIARGERIFFTANDGVHGVELWQSDGSPEGTTMVGDIYPGARPSSPGTLTLFGNRLIFSATDGTATGRELWAVDLDILPQTGWIFNGGYQ